MHLNCIRNGRCVVQQRRRRLLLYIMVCDIVQISDQAGAHSVWYSRVLCVWLQQCRK